MRLSTRTGSFGFVQCNLIVILPAVDKSFLFFFFFFSEESSSA